MGDEGSAERGNWFFRPRPEKKFPRAAGLAAAKQGSPPHCRGQNGVVLHTARSYSQSPRPYSHTRPRHRQPTVHQFTIFGRFPAFSCTPRTPIYNFWPFFCIFVYAPSSPVAPYPVPPPLAPDCFQEHLEYQTVIRHKVRRARGKSPGLTRKNGG